MPRKNPRPAAKKRRAKLRLATLNGKKTPTQFRLDNPQITDHAVLALAMAMHGIGKLKGGK